MPESCIIIPCFNEAARLPAESFGEFVRAHNDIDLIFVNDGSTDDTAAVLKNMETAFPASVMILSLPVNCGKAEATRRGVLKALEHKKQYACIGFWDADLSTPLSDIPVFINHIITHNYHLVIGSRIQRLGSVIKRNPARHYLGRIFSTFASLILDVPVYDTQCGCKVYRREYASAFEEKFITKWIFDIELIARFRNKHGKEALLRSVLEYPLTAWVEKGDSRLKLTHLFRIPLDLWRIHRAYNSNR